MSANCRRKLAPLPKLLKRVAEGDYLYDGKYHIQDFGYDRVRGGRIWNVDDGKHTICQGETLRGAVASLERIISGKEKPWPKEMLHT